MSQTGGTLILTTTVAKGDAESVLERKAANERPGHGGREDLGVGGRADHEREKNYIHRKKGKLIA